MNQGLIYSQKNDVTLEHTIAPHQLQSLDFLAANQMELEEMITTELEKNPVLEIAEDAGPDETDNTEPDADDWENGPDPIGQDYETPYETENLDENRDDFSESLDRFMENGTDFFQNEDDSRGNIFDSRPNEISFQDFLLGQLKDIPVRHHKIAEEIIGNIGDNGYFESALAEIAQVQQCSLAEAEEALAWVQTFDPPGVGARDLKECLLLQIARNPEKHPVRLTELVRDHLEDVSRNRLPQIAKAMSITMDELQTLIAGIRKLSPHPGTADAPDHAIYIRPEMYIEKDKNGTFRIIPAKETLPRLRIVSNYQKMLDDPFVPDDAKAYIREKISAALQLMHNLEQRKSTILQVTEEILTAQPDYFENGVTALRPMTMKEIAEKIGRDESTISRTVANKYIQTPHGLVEMRSFFSGGYKQENGTEVSARGIKEIIRDAVSDEDPYAPLSDSKIEKILKDKGFTVARRTIAKYREELGILSSQQRKQFRA